MLAAESAIDLNGDMAEKECNFIVMYPQMTKDTRDKNTDKPSWPLSCCIPDLPLDK